MKRIVGDTVSSLYQRLCGNASLILMCMLLGAMHMLYQGYMFGAGNHSVHIPLLKSYFHPELYPNDPMVATRSHFITFYFIFLAAIERLFGHLEFIFFAAQFITAVLIFMAIYHFALALFRDRTTAIIAVLFLFTNKIMLGGPIIHWNHHTHTYAVMPLILWSFALFMNRRPRKAYALLGFAANINVQSVIFVLPMFALVSLLQTRQKSAEIGWRNAIIGLLKEYGFFVLFSLPCVIWAITKTGGPLTDEWIQQLRARSTHHSFPLSWDVKVFIDYLLFFTLGLITWALALKNSEDRERHKILGWFGLVILLLCGAGVVFAEWLPLKIVLRSQLFRSTKFMTIFILFYASYAIRYLWDRSAGHRVLAVGTFLVLFLPAYFWFLLLLVILYQIVEARNLHWWVAPVVAAVLILRIYTSHTGFPGNIDLNGAIAFIRPFFEVKPRSAILAIFVFWWGIRKATSIRWLNRLSAGVAFLLIFVYVLPAMHDLLVPPVEKRGNWVQMQVWARKNTPQDAMFLVPPSRQAFRVYSERSIVVDEKDGTQQYFDTHYSYEWWARKMEIERDGVKYADLSPERLLEICQKYGVTHLVFPTAKPLPFQQVYQDNDYRIYLPAPPDSGI